MNSQKEISIKESNRNEHLEFMARMVSHNLRSPMAGMKMLFSMIDLVKEPEQKEELLDNLKEGSEVLFGMIEDLSKIFLDYTELNKEPETIVLNEAVDKALQSLSEEFDTSAINIELTGDTKLMFSSQLFDTIIYELLSNCLRFKKLGENVDVKIELKSNDSQKTLIVSDNGQGIDLSNHGAQIFKMYKAFGETAGKGNGLFIVKNAVEIQGGKVTFESEIGKGSVVTLNL